MNFLYTLPAILGFTGFIIFLVMRDRRPPSPVLLEILAIVRERSGAIPKLDKRLSGKAVYELLAHNQELRKAISPEELELLNGIRISEEKETRLVFAFLGIALVLSLALFVVLEWRPWDDAPPRPISELIYNVKMRVPVTAEHATDFAHVKNRLQSLLTESRQQPNPRNFLADHGLILTGSLDPNESRIESFVVTLVPGKPFAKELADGPDSIPGKIYTNFMLTIAVVENNSAAIQAVTTDPHARKMWEENLMGTIVSPYMPLTVSFDFRNDSVVFAFHNLKAFEPRVTQAVKYWEDFKGRAIILLPLSLSVSQLEQFEISSSVGPEQPDRTRTLEARTHEFYIGSRNYFVYR